MLICIYCRVSTDEQAKEGVSLDEQKTRLKAYCFAMGWKAEVIEFIDDGFSAKNLSRPGLQALLKGVKEGEVAKVLVTKLDRLSRRLLDLLTLIELFGQYNVDFVSTSESFDTATPSGRLTLQVLGAVAEFERERIRERVFENMLHAAKSGRWLTQHPYGYRLENKELVIYEPEAEVVRRVFSMFLKDGLGYFSIAKRLNEEGILSRHNKEWSLRAVKLMLTNPAYVGTLVWNRTDSSKKKRKLKEEDEWVVLPNVLPSVIDREIWDKVQECISSRKKVPPRAKASPHLLGGLLRCGCCGAAMSISWSGWPKRHRVYRCSAYNNKGTCQSKPYRADELEQWFKEGLKNLLDSVDCSVHKVFIQRTFQKKIASNSQKIKNARARYERQVQAYAAGLIELKALAREKEQLERELAELNEQMAGKNEAVNYNELESMLQEQKMGVIEGIESLPVEEAKARLQVLVEKVIVYDYEDLEIALQL